MGQTRNTLIVYICGATMAPGRGHSVTATFHKLTALNGYSTLPCLCSTPMRMGFRQDLPALAGLQWPGRSIHRSKWTKKQVLPHFGAPGQGWLLRGPAIPTDAGSIRHE